MYFPHDPSSVQCLVDKELGSVETERKKCVCLYTNWTTWEECGERTSCQSKTVSRSRRLQEDSLKRKDACKSLIVQKKLCWEDRCFQAAPLEPCVTTSQEFMVPVPVAEPSATTTVEKFKTIVRDPRPPKPCATKTQTTTTTTTTEEEFVDLDATEPCTTEAETETETTTTETETTTTETTTEEEDVIISTTMIEPCTTTVEETEISYDVTEPCTTRGAITETTTTETTTARTTVEEISMDVTMDVTEPCNTTESPLLDMPFARDVGQNAASVVNNETKGQPEEDEG